MYITPLKTLIVKALEKTFDAEYPIADFRKLPVTLDYPVKEQDYPGIWVDFEQSGDLQVAGIGHVEYIEDDNDTARKGTRWKFQGWASFTVVAVDSSLERDRLMDEMIRVIAFGRENPATSEFRDMIEHNEFIGCSFDWDEIGATGKGESPGSPWGGDEIVYEQTISMECYGDFVADWATATLIRLSAITFVPEEVPILAEPRPE